MAKDDSIKISAFDLIRQSLNCRDGSIISALRKIELMVLLHNH
jgi:hypothetical protein